MKRRRRTRQNDSSPKRKRTKNNAEEGIEIPPYRIGCVVNKGPGTYNLVIIKDHVPGDWTIRFTLVEKFSKQRVKGYWTPKELAILGYEIDEEWDFETTHKFISLLSDEVAGRSKAERKKKKRTWPDKCGEGKQHSLEDCIVAEGKSPLVKGNRVRMRGNRVHGLKVVCPVCLKKVSVKWYPREKLYKTVRHKPWGGGPTAKRIRTKDNKKRTKKKPKRTRRVRTR